MTVDLTKGKPARVLFGFALPMMLSVLLQQLYVLMDLFIVGNFTAAPEQAVAAIAAASSVTAIDTAIAVGFNTGCSVLIARLFGGKAYSRMHKAVRIAMVCASVMGLMLTLVGELFCRPLLLLIDTPAASLPDAVAYLRIYSASLVAVFVYNISTGICNALGDSKTPLFFLALSSVGNIALDLLFVRVLGWDVRGAAWATLLAQCVSAVCLLAVLIKRLHTIEPTEESVIPSDLLHELLSLSVPTILQQSIVAVGNFLIQKVIDGLGSESTIAGFSTALRINTFATACFVTVSGAIASFTAQNLGAKEEARVRSGFSAGVRMLYGLILPIAGGFFVCAPLLVRLFLREDSCQDVLAAVQAGSAFLRVVSPFYLVIAVKIAIDGMLRGHGAMKYFTASTLADLLLRVSLCYLLAAVGCGIFSIPIAWAVGWTVACLLAAWFYHRRVWEPHSIKNKKE